MGAVETVRGIARRSLTVCHVWRNRVRMEGRGPLVLGIRNKRMGFFAHLNWTLYVHKHCDAVGRECEIQCFGSNYGEAGRDWVPLFLKRTAAVPTDARRIDIFGLDELGLPATAKSMGSFAEAHRIFTRHYEVCTEIRAEVEAWDREFDPNDAIGVHYRGTDKGAEAVRASMEHHWELACRSASALGKKVIFVSSDEQAFVDLARSRSGGHRILFRADSVRSVGNGPVHLGAVADGYKVGRDALVNVLILSRCSHLIKSPSMFSGWAKVFRPELPVFMVGQLKSAFDYFPDGLISSADGDADGAIAEIAKGMDIAALETRSSIG